MVRTNYEAVQHVKETKGQEPHLVVFASEVAGVVHGHVGRLAIVRFEAPQVEPLPAHLRKATGVLLGRDVYEREIRTGKWCILDGLGRWLSLAERVVEFLPQLLFLG